MTAAQRRCRRRQDKEDRERIGAGGSPLVERCSFFARAREASVSDGTRWSNVAIALLTSAEAASAATCAPSTPMCEQVT
jgi:hypothetical protein